MLAWIKQLAADERIVGFVVGLPVHTSGNESQKSREARAVRPVAGASRPACRCAISTSATRAAQAEALLLEAGLTKQAPQGAARQAGRPNHARRVSGIARAGGAGGGDRLVGNALCSVP